MKVTRAELLAQREQASRDCSIANLALNYLVRGEFHTIGKRCNYTVQVAGCTDAHGGIVLQTYAPRGQRAYSAAYYLEQWCDSQTQWILPADQNKEAIALLEMAREAKEYARKAQSADNLQRASAFKVSGENVSPKA